MAKIIGMEIGNETIKLAVCVGGKVKKLIAEQLPDNMVREGRIVIPDAMSDYLSGLKKKYRLGGGDVSVVLPSFMAFTKRFIIPAMSDSELRLNLPYEFKDYLEQEKTKDEYIYDYVILKVTYEEPEAAPAEEADGKKKAAPERTPKDYLVYAAAVKQQAVDDYVSIFKKAGFRLRRAMTYEMALQGIMDNAQNAPADVCVIDIGAGGTLVNLFYEGKFEMGKAIDAGGAFFDEKIAAFCKVDSHTAKAYKEANQDNCQSLDSVIDTYNFLAIEAMKVVNFYRYNSQSEGHTSVINDIYFAGGSSLIETLRTRLVKSTELQPHDIAKLIDVPESEAALCNICFAAVGAGIAK